MLDDQAMEKKPTTRCSLQGAKGGSAETKFKQDGVGKFSRGPRRKESPGQRNEGPRKPNPQKNRNTLDKRPRPRGTINLGDRSEVVETELLEESASKTKNGSRKVNLNHLLNFTFASRENDFSGSHHGHYDTRAKFRLPKYSKEQFLQANCQFVVLEGADYAVHLVDPDTLVDWRFIEEVRLSCHEVPSCPICLYPATAAKITLCGHIYCWTCILHYLSLSDRSWCKCPICYQAVYKDDLKSVVSMAKAAPRVGEELRLTLMRRERGSQFVVPATQWAGDLRGPLNVTGDPLITPFQKLLVANKEDALSVLLRELNELQSQLAEIDNPEQCFIEAALDALEQRRQALLAKTASCEDNLEPVLLEKLAGSDEENRNASDQDPALASITDAQSNLIEDTCKQELDTVYTDEEQASSSLSAEKQAPVYYFYQASDGQQIYMHSINVRMLVKEYGCLENCPPEITATAMELDTFSMTQVLRKRMRYLQHLPLTCVFQVAELQLSPPLISQSTVNFFNVEVQKRHRARTRKAREERRRERHIEQEENKKIGKYPSPRFSMTSLKHFPACNSISTDEDPPLTPEDVRSPSPASVSTQDLDQDDASSVGSTESRPTSFAQMLRDGKTRMERTTIPEIQGRAASPAGATFNSDGEECAPAPKFNVTFGDAIQAAMNNMTLRNPDSSSEEKKPGKRKKMKKTLLFTTSMSRSK